MASFEPRLAEAGHGWYDTSMVDIHIEYQGELRCKAKHGPSGVEIVTDAPVDNHGKGESFSPTDLLATALGTCMITVMGIFATRHDIELRGTKVHVKKVMTSELPRRVKSLAAEIIVPADVARTVDEKMRAALTKAAETCPVRLSLGEIVDTPLVIEWSV